MQDPPVAGCGDSYIPNARADNAIAYRGKFGGLTLAVDELRGGPGAFSGLISADKVERRISASGYVTVGTIDNDGSLALSVSGGAPGSSPVAGGWRQGVMVGVRHAF